MAHRDESETFWDFSLRTYGRGGVADACLYLQDEHGVDVNLLLYCCWMGGRAPPLNGAEFARAREFSESWAGRVVRPLRGARRWMKAAGCGEDPIDTEACMKLRQKIKTAELEAERLQQLALESLPPSGAGRGEPGAEGNAGPEVVAANLGRLLDAGKVSPGNRVLVALKTIARAAYPDAGPDWPALDRIAAHSQD